MHASRDYQILLHRVSLQQQPQANMKPAALPSRPDLLQVVPPATTAQYSMCWTFLLHLHVLSCVRDRCADNQTFVQGRRHT